ncbi:MAG: hypothetical protein U1E17_09140 [Geminicoccaceae bacterium]
MAKWLWVPSGSTPKGTSVPASWPRHGVDAAVAAADAHAIDQVLAGIGHGARPPRAGSTEQQDLGIDAGLRERRGKPLTHDSLAHAGDGAAMPVQQHPQPPHLARRLGCGCRCGGRGRPLALVQDVLVRIGPPGHEPVPGRYLLNGQDAQTSPDAQVALRARRMAGVARDQPEHEAEAEQAEQEAHQVERLVVRAAGQEQLEQAEQAHQDTEDPLAHEAVPVAGVERAGVERVRTRRTPDAVGPQTLSGKRTRSR